jgi:dTDP-4-dehydrorhamnose 3,5-epimerase
VIFTETKLAGAFIIGLEQLSDERGFFARAWCQQEFAAHRLNSQLAQCNISFNKKKGTLRGMHYQAKPYEEAKLVRCTAGAIYDVIVDLRPNSPTFTEHVAVELTSRNYTMLYIPEGFAHGFLTLEDETEVFYQMSTAFVATAARGVRWNDPAFNIHWPSAVEVLSERDRSYADFFQQ